MKSRIITGCISGLAIVLSVFLMFSAAGCKDFGAPDYTLTITFQEGVTGTPAAGTYTHDELAEIDYLYTATDGESPTGLIVNGNFWEPVGKFTMYTNLEVTVRLIDVRGTWNIKLDTTSTTDEDQEYTITFNGDSLVAGTFSDDRGYNGTWEIANRILTITYGDWADYVLVGAVSTMKGDWTGEEKKGPGRRAIR